MDWLGEAASRLRRFLAELDWLGDWQAVIARTPDWALLAVGPALLLLLFATTLLLGFERKPRNGGGAKPAFESKSAIGTPPEVTESTRSSGAITNTVSRALTTSDDGDRSVRVFVSSTFLDMQAERRELATKVFPALRTKFAPRGIEIFEVDLRWGITQEQQERGETLPTLLAEIDRCRPYFVCLLGERFGWTPPPDALTEKLRADYPSIAEADGMSVTAMEIMHGVLNARERQTQAIFLERDANWDWRAHLNDTERATADEEPDDARSKLSDLKSKIREHAKIDTYAHPDEIGSKVSAALEAMLEERFPETEKVRRSAEDERLHSAYARTRRGLHVAADAYLRHLDRWIELPDPPPLLVTGASGAGKSALIANWIQSRRLAKPEHAPFIFEHYLSAGRVSADADRLVGRMLEHLRLLADEEPTFSYDRAERFGKLSDLLSLARERARESNAPLLIALDGLDKLTSERDLRWLPRIPGVALIVSSKEGPVQAAAVSRGFQPMEVKPLTHSERRQLIEAVLARWKRQLEPRQIDLLLRPASDALGGSPLYLATVLEELRISASHARLEQMLKDYLHASSMPGLFAQILARLETSCPAGVVAQILPLIWAGRAGLEESEILAVTGVAPIDWATLRNGLGANLSDQDGRVTFANDDLKQAVVDRYLVQDSDKRDVHLALASRFESSTAYYRVREELSFQLLAAARLGAEAAWGQLEQVLTDIDRMKDLRVGADVDLLSFWQALTARGRDMETLLCSALEAYKGGPENWQYSDLFTVLGVTDFLDFARVYGPRRIHVQEIILRAAERLDDEHVGLVWRARTQLASLYREVHRFADAEPLLRRALADAEVSEFADKQILALQDLANLLAEADRCHEAEPLRRRALEIIESQLETKSLDLIVGLANLADILQQTDRHREAEQLFERALTVAQTRLGPEHPVLASLLRMFAETMQALNRPSEAEEALRRALTLSEVNFGVDHPQVAQALSGLGWLLLQRSNLAEAEPILRRALAIDEIAHGDGHPRVATSLGNLAGVLMAAGRYSDAEPMLRRALSIAENALGSDHTRVASHLNNLALLLRETGRDADAETHYRRGIAILEAKLGPNHADVATTLVNLAALLRSARRFDEAETSLRRALAISETSLGEGHPSIAIRLHSLASVLAEIGQHAEARALATRALAINEGSFGENSVQVARSLANLAELSEMADRYDEAEPLRRRALSIFEQELDDDDTEIPGALAALAFTVSTLGRHDEAEALFRRVVTFNEKHERTAPLIRSLRSLGSVLDHGQRFDDAEAAFRRALDLEEAHSGSDHSNLIPILRSLAKLCTNARRHAEAASLYRRILAIEETRPEADHAAMVGDLRDLAESLHSDGADEEAEATHRRALATAEVGLGESHPKTAETLTDLASLLDDAGRGTEAEPLLQRALAIKQTLFGHDDPKLLETIATLGFLLLQLGRGQEAEALHRKALAIAERAYGAEDARVGRVLADLAYALEDLERRDEAEPLYQRALALLKNGAPGDKINAIVAESVATSLARLARRRLR